MSTKMTLDEARGLIQRAQNSETRLLEETGGCAGAAWQTG
jgi:hypothetical protein